MNTSLGSSVTKQKASTGPWIGSNMLFVDELLLHNNGSLGVGPRNCNLDLGDISNHAFSLNYMLQ